MKKIVIAYSGGLDSYIMYHLARKMEPDAEIKAVYWDHGQPVLKKELRKLPPFVDVRKVDWLNLPGKSPIACPGRNEGPIFIPGRNLVFATLIACEDLPDEIWMGTLHGETHNKGTDKNMQFVWATNTVLNYVLAPFYGDKKIEIKFPLVDLKLNKLEAVKWALNAGLTPKQLVAETNSCHSSETENCGKCVQCIKRWAVFGQLGFKEQYDVNPPTSEMAHTMLEGMITSIITPETAYYNKESIDEIFPFLANYALKNESSFHSNLIAKIKYIFDNNLYE